MIGRSDFLAGLGGLGTVAATGIEVPQYAATVAIGVVCPLSGSFRSAGEQLANGVRGAIDFQNRERFGFDKIFTLRTFDDQNGVADAMVNGQFAIDDPTIVAVIGHLGAKATVSVLKTYAQAQMPLIAPAVTADALTAQGYHNVLRLPTRDFVEGQLLAKFVTARSSPKTPHLIVQDGDYGADVANGYTQQFGTQKIDCSGTIFAYDKPDFGAAADKALTAKPDHILLAGTAQDMGPIVKVLRDKGYTGPLAAPQGFFDAVTASKYAAECEGIVISTSMPYLALAPSAFRLLDDYQGSYGPIVPVAAFAYAAAQIVMSAVKRTGATQRATLMNTMTLGGSYDTIVGSFTFAPTGDPIDPELYFYTIAGGKFSYLKQAHSSAFLSR
jgi:branched-chain amino acid transport system substrate-binding protein